MKKILFFLIIIFFFSDFCFSQDDITNSSFGLHGGFKAVDNKSTSENYSSTGPFLEAEFAFNINKNIAPFIAFDIGTIRKREFSFYSEKTYLMHYYLFYLGFRYTYNLNNKFGIFAQIQGGMGEQKSQDKTPPREFSFGNWAYDISIGLGAKYSITKFLDVSTKAKFHEKNVFSFFGGLNFNITEIMK
jgi:hypothetical protein